MLGFLKASFSILHFSYYTLMIFLMASSVILLFTALNSQEDSWQMPTKCWRIQG